MNHFAHPYIRHDGNSGVEYYKYYNFILTPEN